MLIFYIKQFYLINQKANCCTPAEQHGNASGFLGCSLGSLCLLWSTELMSLWASAAQSIGIITDKSSLAGTVQARQQRTPNTQYPLLEYGKSLTQPSTCREPEPGGARAETIPQTQQRGAMGPAVPPSASRRRCPRQPSTGSGDQPEHRDLPPVPPSLPKQHGDTPSFPKWHRDTPSCLP